MSGELVSRTARFLALPTSESRGLTFSRSAVFWDFFISSLALVSISRTPSVLFVNSSIPSLSVADVLYGSPTTITFLHLRQMDRGGSLRYPLGSQWKLLLGTTSLTGLRNEADVRWIHAPDIYQRTREIPLGYFG